MKMHATINYLREAARLANLAADRLEERGPYHQELARASAEGSIKNLERCVRQIDRAQAERADRLRAMTTPTTKEN